jgi:hypothetical protein
VKHDMLLDQISFLSFEKSSRDSTFDNLNAYNGILDGLSENLKDFKDDDKFYSDNEEGPFVKEEIKEIAEEEKIHEAQEQAMNTSTSTIQPDSSPEKDEIIERPTNLDLSQTDSIDNSGDNLVASTPSRVYNH